MERAEALGLAQLADDAVLVTSELVTNAVFHGGGCRELAVDPIDGGLRVCVRDANRLPPVLARPSDSSLTGRGMHLVASIAAAWGVELLDDGGKIVWAHITPAGRLDRGDSLTADELLAMWDDSTDDDLNFRIELGDVPTDLLLEAKSHVDNVLRELTLASSGASSGTAAAVPSHLTELLAAVADFAEARLAIKRQALEAAKLGAERTHLALDLPPAAAEAAERYLAALDEIDAYCRARRMLTLESPPQHRVFRRWYVEELVRQLRNASSKQRIPVQPFERRLLAELDRLAIAQRMSERAARLYAVAAALATAATPEEVAGAVLDEGVAALGASGGGLLLTTTADTLALPAAIGYDETVIAKLRTESRHAELPAAVALRTGEPVWLESRQERDNRFPELVGLEASTISLCAVPLIVQEHVLGALRFSFNEPRLFDEDERRFVLALAAQTAQALERAQLHQARLDVSQRLQRSLLPPTLPQIAGIEIAALYRPFGDGMDVGGDFYDVWALEAGRWAFAVGDASGTGPEAATMTALVRYTLRALTLSESDPRRILELLNTALIEGRTGEESDRFCTVSFGVITAGDGGMTIVLGAGGHPEPMVRRSSGAVETIPLRGNFLGQFDSPEIAVTRTELHAGDVMVLLTDGVLEARRAGDLFDVAGVEDVLRHSDGEPAALVQAIEAAVLDFTDRQLDDDVAVLAFRAV